MRKNIFRLAIVAGFISTIISCQKNDETTPSATTGVLARDKFLGTWHVESHHRPSNQTLFWDMTIIASTDTSNKSEIFLDNFDQIGTTNFLRANVNSNSFTVPSQTFSSSTYNGSGTYSGGNLSFSYTEFDGQQTDSVTATAHK
ncbi:MAG: hypothetical protein ACHQHP_06680 [Bacteroidia bacterium]